METLNLLTGALTLRRPTFEALRQHSDVFLRGFLALLVVGLIAGAFASAERVVSQATARNISTEEIVQTVRTALEQSGNLSAAAREMIESYVREGVGMAQEIASLPPNVGPGTEGLAYLLNWLGGALATPFSFDFLGWTFLLGLAVHMTARWLGGSADSAEMLGLTALAVAPRLVLVLTSLFNIAGTLTNAPALSSLNGLLGLVVMVWSLAIYVVATSVAQQISLGRALLALVLAVLLLIALAVMVVIGVLLVIGSFIVPVASTRS